MKKHGLSIVVFLISIIITVGFVGSVYTDTLSFQSYSKIATEDMVILTSQNISNEVCDFLSKPFIVSKTMANDALLKNWIKNENIFSRNSLDLIKRYLKAYKNKYGYQEVFLVSEKTHIYYYNGGMDKVISPSDKYDRWYYDFKNSKNEFNISVDTDEIHPGNIYLFINFKIEDENGNFIGVTGVGLDISKVNNIFEKYQKDYGLKAYITSNSDNIKVYADNSEFFKDLSNLPQLTSYKELLNKNKDINFVWNKGTNENTCITANYINDLDWYVCVEKDMDSTEHAFLSRVKHDLVYVCMILIFSIAVIASVFSKYNKLVIKIENTDEFTGLPNRKRFYSMFEKLHESKTKGSYFFVFDVDHFKLINDNKGHIFGNKVLSLVAKTADKYIDGNGIVSRWGGDEFAGIIYHGSNPEKIFNEIMSALADISIQDGATLTISVGIYKIQTSASIDTVLNNADKALYYSKNNGRNKITYYNKDCEKRGRGTN
jgi:diguanylate cyclase (GGDEF)-like protein